MQLASKSVVILVIERSRKHTVLKTAFCKEGYKNGNGLLLTNPITQLLNHASTHHLLLIQNKRLHRLQREAHVGAKLCHGDELVIGFLEVVSDFVDEVTAVALAFAGDALDVFGVNAEADGFRLHDALVLIASQRFTIVCKVTP